MDDAMRAIVPRDLQDLPQWVVWRVELRPGRNGDKKPTKVPYNARTGALASSTDPNTWSTLQTALRALDGHVDYNGVGFVVTKDNGFTGIDLDDCYDEVTEEIEAWAHAIVEQMQSYTEISPSMTGLRIWIRANLPHGDPRANRRRTGSLEMYDEARFFTVTGNALLDYPLAIEERQEQLDALHKATFAVTEAKPRKATPSEPVRLDDQALIKKAQEAKNGQKFFHLWRGEASDYGDDLSRADLALCGMLAFWTGGDAARIDRLFRQSGLMRDKWDSQRGESTYGQRTILTALSTLGETYSPIPLQSRRENSQERSQQAGPRTDGSSALKHEPEPAPEDNLHCTDMGNARRLVKRHGADLRYVAIWKQWLVWDGKRWRRDDTLEAMRRAKDTVTAMWADVGEIEDKSDREKFVKWIYSSESNKGLTAMLATAQSEPEIAATTGCFDNDPWALNVPNGTLDLKTGQLRPHRREDMLTKMAGAEYDPNAELSLWDEFLDTITDGNEHTQDFLRRAAGYTITGATTEEKLFFPHGPTRTGKSTFLEALKAMLGDYAMTADFESFLSRPSSSSPRDDVADFVGARMVASIEVDEGKKIAEGLVKTLTGGDTVRARNLYQKGFEYKPQFKLWLAANHAPRVDANDDAMWQRILRVAFEHSLVGKEKAGVKETLRNPRIAGPAILAWAMRGCIEWQAKGLGVPDEVKEATATLRESMDALKDFIADCCELVEDGWETAARLRETYDGWCKANGERFSLNGRKFGEALTRRGCVQHVQWIGGRAVRGWKGISIVAETA